MRDLTVHIFRYLNQEGVLLSKTNHFGKEYACDGCDNMKPTTDPATQRVLSQNIVLFRIFFLLDIYSSSAVVPFCHFDRGYITISAHFLLLKCMFDIFSAKIMILGTPNLPHFILST